jgi:ribosomal protein S18 acetylase RimI-like enzyme
MSIISVNKVNINNEHICCAITDKKGENCVSSKKAWLKERFEEGLIFKKLDVRGKVFIEYLPAENAWCPIVAPNYMHINCFWVSGQYKGQGYGNELLENCIKDAQQKGMNGITVISSKKKMPFLSDPIYLKRKGFIVADTAKPYYELLYLPFENTVTIPKFKDSAKEGIIEDKGLVLYYSNQCPHTEKYAPLLQEFAGRFGKTVKLIKYETKEQAQNAPSPFTTYSLFVDGTFVTNEILSESRFKKIMGNLK